MESLKDVHQSVCTTLRAWGYETHMPIYPNDLRYAIYHSIGETSPMFKYHALCMSVSGALIDYGGHGDHVYGLDEGYEI